MSNEQDGFLGILTDNKGLDTKIFERVMNEKQIAGSLRGYEW